MFEEKRGIFTSPYNNVKFPLLVLLCNSWHVDYLVTLGMLGGGCNIKVEIFQSRFQCCRDGSSETELFLSILLSQVPNAFHYFTLFFLIQINFKIFFGCKKDNISSVAFSRGLVPALAE